MILFPVLRLNARRLVVAAVLMAGTAIVSQPLHATTSRRLPPGGGCQPFHGDAAALLARTVNALALPTDGRVLRYPFRDDVSQNYQSDRMYAPYLWMSWGGTFYSNPATRVQRLEERMFGLGNDAPAPMVLLHAERSTYAMRDTTPQAFAGGHGTSLRSRALDPWTVIADWRASSDVQMVEKCIYREFPRVVLQHTSTMGVERLYIDPTSALPIKLERREPHFLWGDVLVEYLWTNWQPVGASLAPVASYRLVDGESDIVRNIGPLSLIRADSAPRLTLPANAPDMPTSGVQWPAPDTVRIGAQAFMLVNRAYRNVVMLARDTVWVLDAQIDERRARQDAAWIARLFPGTHAVALVVTDLAWPHIGGVRYWVARGATVYSHRLSQPFLSRVVERRWTLAPDTLELVRRASPLKARMHFRAVSDSMRLASGALALHVIDGVSSEGALMAWIAGDRFLYAGDYVQTVAERSTYGGEVLAAAARVGIAPTRLAAMHLPITAWDVLSRAQRAAAAAAPSP